MDALSRIHQERSRAQKDFAEFVKTPAGKIWQKYPYWDPSLCQKIAEGQVVLGMSKGQVGEAIGDATKVKKKRIGENIEEWVVEGKEKMVLRFEDNSLRAWEGR